MTKPLLETSRRGYVAAISASSYSYVSLLKHFLPIMNPGMYLVPRFIYVYPFASCPLFADLFNYVIPQDVPFETNNGFITGGSSISLTYIASERIIPGYTLFFSFSVLLFTKT